MNEKEYYTAGIDPHDEVLKNYTNSFLKDPQFLHTLISNLPGYVYRCHSENNEWCTQFASDGIYDLTGFYAADFLKGGKHAYGWLVHPDDKEILSDVVKTAIKEKKVYKIVYRIKTAKGEEKWVWEQGRGVYDDKGKLTATEGFILDITEKKIAEDKIVKRNKELAALNDISLKLSKLADKQKILEIIYKQTIRLFDNNNFYIALYDNESKIISFPICFVNGKKSARESRQFSNGFIEYVINNGNAVLINNDLVKVISDNNIDYKGLKPKSIIAVPMIISEKVTGIITFQDFDKENAFEESDLNILTTIASQAAVALENSHLYETLQIELDEKKKAENKLMISLKEKEILLQEVHHRVKNNLQIMSSLLRLQSTYLDKSEGKQYFLESENRIKSMAIIHNKLYTTKNYEKVDFHDYIKTLVNNLIVTYAEPARTVKVNMDVENILINIDTAIPCGLIINELVSNSLKYAFPEKPGNIYITLKKDNDKFNLIVSDDGIGLPTEIDLRQSKTLGMRLVNLLINQMGGNLKITNNIGSSFQIIFDEVKYKERNV